MTAEHLFLHANLSRRFCTAGGKFLRVKGRAFSFFFFRVGEGWEEHVFGVIE